MHDLDPAEKVADFLSGKTDESMPFARQNRPVWIWGAGKAAAAMAKGVEDALGTAIQDGLVIVPAGISGTSRRIMTLQGNHPIPEYATYAASLELEEMLRLIPQDALVIGLISGGASSLLCLPEHGLELDAIAETYRVLLGSGASITEMNTVRRRLCRFKGGKLARMLHDRDMITLIYSDVPGNMLQDIGTSGRGRW